MIELKWQKPARCNASNCVEVATSPESGQRFVRNSKHPNGSALSFTSEEWEAFEASIRAGQRF